MTTIDPGALLVGKYRVERLIGRGGTALVFRAYDREQRRHVVLKQLRPEAARDAEAIQTFLREGKLARRAQNEHVVRAYGTLWLAPNEPLLIFEYLPGNDLARVVRQRGTLTVREAVAHAKQACSGLAAIHAAGIIHADIKPSNLMLTSTSAGPRVKIVDFGAAHSCTQELRKGLVGSPPFMPPEQLRDEPSVGERRDLWALGAALFTLLAGRSPFERRYLTETWQAILTGDVPDLSALRSDVPRALSAIVKRCLATEPSRRFASAQELGAALTPFACTPCSSSDLERLSA